MLVPGSTDGTRAALLPAPTGGNRLALPPGPTPDATGRNGATLLPATTGDLLPAPTGGGGSLLPATTSPAALATLEDLLCDQLTQLGGLFALRRNLELLIDRYQPFGFRPGLVLIDIDGFKRVNSAYGREAGDQVLMAMAARLRTLLPVEGTIYRTGGDEFVALLGSVEMVDGVAAAQRIQADLSQPFELGPSVIRVTVSAAIVMLGHRHRVDELLRDADVAMFRAKSEGGNRVDIYNPELDSWSTARRKQTDLLEKQTDLLEKQTHVLEKEVEDLRRKNRILSEALTTDLATGMPNALALDTDQIQADAWRKRSGEPYSVLRVRVDGIYEASHEFRAAGGSDALTAVAHAIRDTLRTSDRAYLLDLGEFAALLRGSTLKQAVLASERVRATLQKHGIVHPADPNRVVTVTVAAIEAGYRHSGPHDVLKEVDDLLEKAGDQGGDRVVWPI